MNPDRKATRFGAESSPKRHPPRYDSLPALHPGGLEPEPALGNIHPMETHRRPGSPFQDATPPILDMTPEGEFRDPLPPPGGLDRVLGKVGGIALLLTLAAGGLLLVALAVLFVG